MKLFCIIYFFLFTSNCWSADITYNDLIKKEGIFYILNTEKPFSGKILGAITGEFYKGKKFGKFIT